MERHLSVVDYEMRIGQNMAVLGAKDFLWTDALKSWEDEKANFKYGDANDEAMAYVQVRQPLVSTLKIIIDGSVENYGQVFQIILH